MLRRHVHPVRTAPASCSSTSAPPEAPHTAEVRRYLREFLSDPRVIDMNPLGRFLLLNLIILPFRPARSAEAYEKIWTPEGSPLLVYGRQLAEGVARALPEAEVVLAMRYGQPSLAAGLDRLRAAGCDHIVVVPLYPQYASSTTGSTLEAVYALAAERWNTPFIQVLPPFFDDAAFLEAFAAQGRDVLAELKPEHVLFSFHGLPERQVRKSDEVGDHCLVKTDCCAVLTHANRNCYRAQCVATARGIAERLGSTLRRTPSRSSRASGACRGFAPTPTTCSPNSPGGGSGAWPSSAPHSWRTASRRSRRSACAPSSRSRRPAASSSRSCTSLNASPAWIDALAALIRPRL
jgi:ferrochelatase